MLIPDLSFYIYPGPCKLNLVHTCIGTTCRATLVAATYIDNSTLYAQTCLATNPYICLYIYIYIYKVSQFVFCDQIPMSLVTRSEWVTKCNGMQNRHVFTSVYDICNGIQDIATSSSWRKNYSRI